MTVATLLAPAQETTDLTRLRELVEAGAMPRAALEKAQAAIDDRNDDGLLRRTLYGSLRIEDTTEIQAAEMVAAAERRLQRKQARVDQLKPLVEQGIMARVELTPHIEELDERRRTLDLARSRADFLRQMAEMARTELALQQQGQDDSSGVKPVIERFDGNSKWSPVMLRQVTLAFESQFGKALPVSANGQTSLHNALGFDHRGRVDIALSPDQPEGKWLRDYLEQEQIPFYAIRGAIPGKATAPHIHIGPPSLRLRVAD